MTHNETITLLLLQALYEDLRGDPFAHVTLNQALQLHLLVQIKNKFGVHKRTLGCASQ